MDAAIRIMAGIVLFLAGYWLRGQVSRPWISEEHAFVEWVKIGFDAALFKDFVIHKDTGNVTFRTEMDMEE